jgi:signal transduction histidine kinase
LDHVRQIVRTEPEVAEAGLDAARAEVRAVIADIRRMSRELRPPALDSLGLVGAVREQAAALGAEAPGPPDIVVDAPKALPPLPAAVEVAAYRIAVEAMMNVVRHASATTCRVELTLDPDALDIEVIDNGSGLDGSSTGVGLRSMRERAAEVGGDVMITDGETGGTRVLARLPVDLSALGVADA